MEIEKVLDKVTTYRESETEKLSEIKGKRMGKPGLEPPKPRPTRIFMSLDSIDI
jgi:hypothetical protein